MQPCASQSTFDGRARDIAEAARRRDHSARLVRAVTAPSDHDFDALTALLTILVSVIGIDSVARQVWLRKRKNPRIDQGFFVRDPSGI